MNKKPLSNINVYEKIIKNLDKVSDNCKIRFDGNIIGYKNGKVILKYYLINRTNNEWENKELVFKSEDDWNRTFENFRTPITDIESCWIRLLEEEQDYMHFAQVNNCRLCGGKDYEIGPFVKMKRGHVCKSCFLKYYGGKYD